MGIPVQVSFDAARPRELARFWALALDYVEQPPPEGFTSWEEFGRRMGIPEEQWDDFAAVVDPAGNGPRLLFQRVPEGKTAKNRVHLDVNVSAPEHDWASVLAHVDRLVAAGATAVQEHQDATSHWFVMLDPEGNEFCLQ